MPRFMQADGPVWSGLRSYLIVASAAVLAVACAGKVNRSSAQPAPAAHRALYELSLSRAASGSEIADVSGFLAFEWSEACDAWLTDQRFTLDYAYQNAEPTRFISDLSSWEKKDGSEYRFDMRRIIDGVDQDHIAGRATREPDDRPTAYFDEPEQEVFVLPEPTLFPTDHLFAILRAAANGERFITLPLFDGSEFEGATPVTAFVHGAAQRAAPAPTIPDNAALASDLLKSRAYDIRLAFFEDDENAETPTPAYEMTLTLHENGLVSAMTLDYERFSLVGRLTALNALDAPDC